MSTAIVKMLPLPAALWTDTLGQYLKTDAVHRCPAVDAANHYTYAFNSDLSGKSLQKLPDPAATRAIHESDTFSPNASDTGTSLPDPPRHNGGDITGYADGHVKWVRREGAAPPSATPGS